MPRLSKTQRIRALVTFNEERFKGIKKKYQVVAKALDKLNIKISPRALRNIISKWTHNCNTFIFKI